MKELTLMQKLKSKWLKMLKAYAKKKIARGKKLEQKVIDLELKLHDEIHGYNRKTGMEDVK